jgi:hypothetical protein
VSEVNRYLENKAMDHIDHALGRPVDPMAETYRNYFYVIGDTELRRSMAASPHWRSDGKVSSGEYFSVTDEGRRALAEHLRKIGDKNRRWVVSWGGYEMPVVAISRAKARYSKWLDISDTDDGLSFSRFQRESKVRAA